MFIAVHHTIRDVETFWLVIKIEEDSAKPPESSVRLRRAMRNAEGDRAVLLWEAESLDSVRGYVEGLVGDFSQNEYEAVKSPRLWGIGDQSS